MSDVFWWYLTPNLPLTLDFYLLMSDFFGSFWTPPPPLKSDIINARSLRGKLFQKLFDIFHTLKIQKKVSAETICRNMVCNFPKIVVHLGFFVVLQKFSLLDSYDVYRPFTLQPDFWKSSSWEISVYFKPYQNSGPVNLEIFSRSPAWKNWVSTKNLKKNQDSQNLKFF